ncbi:hypothetical protein MRX96_023273 [Rhipicephalus microplus]
MPKGHSHKRTSSARSKDSQSGGIHAVSDRRIDRTAHSHRPCLEEQPVTLAAAVSSSEHDGPTVQPVVRTLRQRRKRSLTADSVSLGPVHAHERNKSTAIPSPTRKREPPESSRLVAEDVVYRAPEEPAETKTSVSGGHASSTPESQPKPSKEEVAQKSLHALPAEHDALPPSTTERPAENRHFAIYGGRRVSFSAGQADTVTSPAESRGVPAPRGRLASFPGEQVESTMTSASGGGQSDLYGRRLSRTSTTSLNDRQSRLEDLLLVSPQREIKKDVSMPWFNHAAVAAAVALFVVVVLLLLLKVLRREITDREPLCSTLDCIDHANTLGLGGRHPPASCTGFDDFVCCGWKPDAQGITFAVTGEALMSWILTVEKLSHGEFDRQATINRPLNMMHACMTRTAGAEDGGVARFIDFVDSSAFTWPTAADDRYGHIQDYGRPLQLLFELSVLWGLPLWFRARITPAVESTRVQLADRAIVVGPTALASTWKTIDVTLTNYGAYSDYLKYFNDTILKYHPPSPSFTTFLVARSARVQASVLT